MVNIEQLNALEKKLKSLITTERTKAEATELQLNQKISDLQSNITDLQSENAKLNVALSTQSQTLLGTIKTCMDGLSDSMAKVNKEVGAITYRLDNEQELLKAERKEIPTVVADFDTNGHKIKDLEDRIEFMSNEIATLKVRVGEPKETSPVEGHTSTSRDGTWESRPITHNRGHYHNTHTSRATGDGDTLITLIQRLDRLEDQSRRDNILVYGVPESSGETWSECESTINGIINDGKLNGDNGDVSIVRAHRLGKLDSRNDNPRPIIVKFLNYKTKDKIISNAKNLEGLNEQNETKFSISQDYCVNTNALRKKLLTYGKTLKNRSHVPIEKYYVNYKTLCISTEADVFKFSLDYIEKFPSSWHNKIH